MNTYTDTQNNLTENVCAPSRKRTRGRPKQEISWPQGEFTFDSLKESNVLSASSIRKKMRAELVRGGMLKVATLKTAFGRPLNVYKKNEA